MIQPPNQGEFSRNNFGSKPAQSQGGPAAVDAPNQADPGSRIANGAFPYAREASQVEPNRMIPCGYGGARTVSRPTDTPPARGVDVEGETQPPGMLGRARP